MRRLVSVVLLALVVVGCTSAPLGASQSSPAGTAGGTAPPFASFSSSGQQTAVTAAGSTQGPTARATLAAAPTPSSAAPTLTPLQPTDTPATAPPAPTLGPLAPDDTEPHTMTIDPAIGSFNVFTEWISFPGDTVDQVLFDFVAAGDATARLKVNCIGVNTADVVIHVDAGYVTTDGSLGDYPCGFTLYRGIEGYLYYRLTIEYPLSALTSIVYGYCQYTIEVRLDV